MTLGKKLKNLRQRRKLTMQELSDRLNALYPSNDGKKTFAKSNFSKWESGKADPSASTIAKIAKFYDVSIDYLLGMENMPMANVRYPVVEIPVLNYIEKGKDIFDYDNIVDQRYIPNHLKIAHQHLAYLLPPDDSMNNVIDSNEILLVNLDEQIENGNIGVFIVNDNNKAIVRKYEKLDDRVLLTPNSTNDQYSAKLYKVDDVIKVGRVISSTHYIKDDTTDYPF